MSRFSFVLPVWISLAINLASSSAHAAPQVEVVRMAGKVPGARVVVVGNYGVTSGSMVAVTAALKKLTIERGSLTIIDARGQKPELVNVLGDLRPNWMIEIVAPSKPSREMQIVAGKGTDAFPVAERIVEMLDAKAATPEQLKDGFDAKSLLGEAEDQFRCNAIRLTVADAPRATKFITECANINGLLTPKLDVARRTHSNGPVRLAILTVNQDDDPPSYSSLRSRDDIQAEFIRGSDIRDGRLDQFDVLLAPGGSGSRQAATIGPDGREKIRDFVRSGGGYFGICAGGYLATCGYDWGLALLDAHTVDREHWARGKGIVDIEVNDAGRALLAAPNEPIHIWYGNGPILARDGRDDLVDFEVLAEYRSEVIKQGVPRGVMPNTPAAVRAPYGEGRVIVFSCHPDIPKPEGTPGLLEWLPRMVYWAAGRDAPKS